MRIHIKDGDSHEAELIGENEMECYVLYALFMCLPSKPMYWQNNDTDEVWWTFQLKKTPREVQKILDDMEKRDEIRGLENMWRASNDVH